MLGILKIPFLLMLVLGVVVAAYLYVSRAEDAVQVKDDAGNAIERAEDLQKQTQDAQNKAKDIQDQLNQ